MAQNITANQKHLDRTMKPEQFSQVVEAISSGRYSWACVLILRFAGYNPLHYIPYRTYSRLLKENRQQSSITSNIESQEVIDYSNSTKSQNISCLNQINDLTYLEPIDNQALASRGGKGSIDEDIEARRWNRFVFPFFKFR